MDNEMNLIGMVQQKKDKHLRCTVTTFLHRTHKFVPTNILQMHGPPSRADDVFDCGSKIIQSRIVLNGAPETVAGFIAKTRDKNRKFPYYLESLEDKSDPGNFYLWPAILEGSSVYEYQASDPSRKIFKSSHGFYIILNDFLDIFGVVKITPTGEFVICQRKIISLSV
ncbi:hypothetical protein K3495_g12558 [Podosphaera aphanis]|nr:hypothetical protein K3495_g12558 [Podosphaera aphanis]